MKNSNIDGFFRDNLEGLEVIPPPEVWEEVRNRIRGKKKKLLLYYRVAAASVTLLLIAGSVWVFFTRQPVSREATRIVPGEIKKEAPAQENPVQDPEQSAVTARIVERVPDREKGRDLIEDAETLSRMDIEQVEVAEIHQPFDQEVSRQMKSRPDDRTDDESLVTGESYETIRFTARTIPLNERIAFPLAVRTVREDQVITGDRFRDELSPAVPEQDYSRWSVRGQFSPIYSFRYIGQKSFDSYRDKYNSQENAMVTYAGGVQVNFNSSSKLSIHSGIFYSRMGQQIGEIQTWMAEDGSVLSLPIKGNLDIRNSTGEINSVNQRLFFKDISGYRVLPLSLVESYDPWKEGLVPMDADIFQSFEYLELPLLIRYKVIDRKIDINVLGGVSANFMIGNDAYAVYHDTKYNIGKTSGLRTTNYSSTVGIGFEYGLTNQISISLEPTFKYFLQSINLEKSVYTHPYSIGIFTGLSYHFE
ncbi:MAG: hypothetical protein JSV24_09205 [Bacteroidales bacterium]|nr:MAG: hypothetical protein JSV24_09205 [Bacteroidales bacterium]